MYRITGLNFARKNYKDLDAILVKAKWKSSILNKTFYSIKKNNFLELFSPLNFGIMMEMMGPDYINFAQQGVQLNLSSAFCSLATPPRRNQFANKRMDSQYKFCSPPSSRAPNNSSKSFSKGSMTRNSPSRLSPSQLHHDFYAGAKFGERPPPTELPKPPNHWMSGNNRESMEQSCIEMTNNLKVLLKVQS